MNVEKIASLTNQLNELTTLRNNTNIEAVATMLDNQILAVKKELGALNPQSDIASAITDKVNSLVDAMTPSDVFEDMHPVVAVKAINGAAMSVMRHVLYRNRVHEAIMARNATMVTASTSAWKKTGVESTSPYENEEDTLLDIQTEVKSAVDAIAQLLCDHNHTCERARRENVKLDVPGNDGHRQGYDDFPTVKTVLQMDAAAQARREQANRTRGMVVKSLTPNVVSMI
jgi:hypothetical protein